MEVQHSVRPRLNILILFYEARPAKNIIENVSQLLSGLSFHQVETAEIPMFATESRTTSVSFFDRFLEMRSCEEDRKTLKATFIDNFAGILIENGIIHPTGATLRFIDHVSLNTETVYSYDELFKTFGSAASRRLGIADETFDTMSFKFYSRAQGVLYELDIGPNIRDPSNIFVELESRYEAVATAGELARCWDRSQEILGERERCMASRLAEGADSSGN